MYQHNREVPALHLQADMLHKSGGCRCRCVCGFNLPVKAPWWPCFGPPAETSYSGSKRKIGKGKRRIRPRVGLVFSAIDDREVGPSELTGPLATNNSD